MKKIRLLMLLLICLLGAQVVGITLKPMEVQAASSFNLIKAVSKKNTPAGKWVKNSKGYRYRYKYSKKYPKGVFRKIKGKIYYFNKKGYRITGLKKYKGKLYYLNKKGALTVGWQAVGGVKYYFSKKSGAAITGWKTINKSRYFFDDQGRVQRSKWIEEYYVGADGKRVTDAWIGEYYVGADGKRMTNTWIGEYYVGADGKRIQSSNNVLDTGTGIIFVGDSRTIGMQDATGSEDIYIGKIGEGYDWFAKSGIKTLRKELDAVPQSKVVFNFGVNDFGNIGNYIQIYTSLIAEYPSTRFYFLSVNPVEEKLAKKNKYNKLVNNANIMDFNAQLKAAFPTRYLDSYSYLVNQKLVENLKAGKGTWDGIHYTTAVYNDIYNFAISGIK